MCKKMNRFIILLIIHSLSLLSSTFGEYERKLKSSEQILALGESIIYPNFKSEKKKLSYVISDLANQSILNSTDGIGLSIVLLSDVRESNPLLSINEEKKSYFELLDPICKQAGKEYHWSATADGVVVFRKTPTTHTTERHIQAE